MKRTNIFTLSSLIAVCMLSFAVSTALAQSATGHIQLYRGAAPSQINAPILTLNEGEYALSYCAGKAGIEGLGANGTSVGAAIYFPASFLNKVKGASVVRLRAALASVASITGLTLWIKSSLKGASLAEVKIASYKTGWNEATLPSPYVIDGTKGLYFGFTYTQTATSYALSLGGEDVANGCYLASNGQWRDYSGQGYGALSIEGILSGITFPSHDVMLSSISFDKSFYSLNKAVTVSGKVKNSGTQAVTSLTLDCEVTGMKSFTRNVNVSIPASGEGSFSFSFTPPYTTAIPEAVAKVTIASLNNGLNDEDPSDNTAQSTFTVATTFYPRTVVFEEATGNWCGYCVRGIVAMRYMKSLYPDNFIGIAVHGDDPMAVSNYINNMSVSGFPSATVDRNSAGEIDVSNQSFLNSYLQENNLLTYAHFDVRVATLSSKQILVRTSTQFDFDMNNADFRYAFVIVEDSVTGYTQANYYTNNAYGAMGGFESKPNPIPASQMRFDEVARGIYPNYYGEKGSVPATFKAGRQIDYTYTLTLPTTLQHRNHISLVALLLNANTGEILNARKVSVDDFSVNTLQWVYNGTALPDNSTLTINDCDEFGQMSAPLGVKDLVSSSEIRIKCEPVELAQGASLQMCLGTTCYPPSTMITGTLTVPNMSTNNSFHAYLTLPDVTKSSRSVVRYVILKGETQAAVVTVNYVYDPAAVKQVESEKLTLARTSDGLLVSGAAAGEEINLYDMAGRRLLTTTANDSGAATIALPQKGIYLVKSASHKAAKVLW